MTPELRPYQKQALNAIHESFSEGAKTVMICLPTGAGKTGVAASWAISLDSRILFLAPNLSIISQLPDELLRWDINAISVGTGYKTWEYAIKRTRCTAIAATAGTAVNRIKNANEFKKLFGGLVIDESHHAPDPQGRKSKQVVKIIQMAQRAGVPVLGMTATPWRLSRRQGFNKTWDVLVPGPSWNDLRGTYLANIRMIRAGGKQVILGAGAASGMDFKEGATWSKNQRNPIFTQGAFDMLLSHGLDAFGALQKTIMYAVGQKHAVNLAELSYKLGIKCGVLISDTDLITKTHKRVLRRALKEGMVVVDRHEVNRQFRAGELRLVINVNMVTEGYDLPDCSCVIVLRPTMSVALWLQMCGRGSRLSPGKDELLLIDLTDNHERLGDPLMERSWSLMPRADEDESAGDPVLRFCADQDSGSCDVMIHTSQHTCPECRRIQGRECNICGKFRMWRSFKVGKKYHEWTCEYCRHEHESPSELVVLMIHKGWTRKGDVYYKLRLEDKTIANVFKFQRWAFNIIDRAYQLGEKGELDEVRPVHKITAEIKMSSDNRWQNVSRVRYFPTAIKEDTRI